MAGFCPVAFLLEPLYFDLLRFLPRFHWQKGYCSTICFLSVSWTNLSVQMMELVFIRLSAVHPVPGTVLRILPVLSKYFRVNEWNSHIYLSREKYCQVPKPTAFSQIRGWLKYSVNCTIAAYIYYYLNIFKQWRAVIPNNSKVQIIPSRSHQRGNIWTPMYLPDLLSLTYFWYNGLYK